jgi:hypothetical protein
VVQVVEVMAVKDQQAFLVALALQEQLVLAAVAAVVDQTLALVVLAVLVL